MSQQHPITPPEDLLQQLRRNTDTWLDQITLAYQAGADQELEACVEWLDNQSLVYHRDLEHTFRTARRPKTLTLKDQALYELNDIYNRDKIDDSTYDTIRRALEALDD